MPQRRLRGFELVTLKMMLLRLLVSMMIRTHGGGFELFTMTLLGLTMPMMMTTVLLLSRHVVWVMQLKKMHTSQH